MFRLILLTCIISVTLALDNKVIAHCDEARGFSKNGSECVCKPPRYMAEIERINYCRDTPQLLEMIDNHELCDTQILITQQKEKEIFSNQNYEILYRKCDLNSVKSQVQVSDKIYNVIFMFQYGQFLKYNFY